VFVPIEGSGRSIISTRSGEDFVVEWSKRGIFVVPSWHSVRHETADLDAVLFSYSDRSIQEALHLFREERGNA
jgi:gentisate 1,2-dioxygenase